MKIVLRQTVEKLGEPGDQVVVAGGFARNYLIPRGLAVPATKGNLRQAADWANSKSAREGKERTSAEKLKATLESAQLRITVQAGPDGQLFGSVTAANISETIKAHHEIDVDRHSIDLPDPIRHLGVHSVRIPLHPEVVAEVPIEVAQAD